MRFRVPRWPLISLLAVMAVVSACSSRRPPPVVFDAPTTTAPPSDPVDIPALIHRGCYACLERALTEARRRDDLQLVFEIAALLTLRAKELGLPHQEWLDLASGAAADDRGRAGLLEIAAAIPPDPLSGVRDAPGARPRLQSAAVNEWLEGLPAAPGSRPFRMYLELALRCSAGGPPAKPDTAIPGELQDVPLIRYRLGICGNAYADHLREVRAADPEFVDADYALGRYAQQLTPYPDLDGAVRLLQSSARAFPRSSAIATSLGDVYGTIEEWNDAVRAYDAALALVEGHPEAQRGRLVALSSLGQHEAAIDAATRMMQGQWYLGEAYYWRAWNHLQLGNLEAARADRGRMKTLRLNSRVYLLSGLIDWRLGQLEAAEVEFEESLSMDFGQCDAATFLGGVRNARGKSREALEAFTHAVQCNDLEITLRRERIRTVETSDAPEAYKLREIARHERGIEQAARRRDEAAYGVDVLRKYLTSIQAPQSPQRR